MWVEIERNNVECLVLSKMLGAGCDFDRGCLVNNWSREVEYIWVGFAMRQQSKLSCGVAW
jgi:hypothetical protein